MTVPTPPAASSAALGTSARRADGAAPDEGIGAAAPLRIVRPRRARLADAARSTRAEIHLGCVRHNLRELKACLAGVDGRGHAVEIWPVLKADAYGHGATAIATTVERAGADGLCVALLEEGIELRGAGVQCPILVMGGSYGRHRDGLEALVEHQLIPVVHDADQLQSLASTLHYLKLPAALGVHLKVDTGMGRLGARYDDLQGIIDTLRRSPQFELVGLMTHLACADAELLEQTTEQLRRFEQATAFVAQAGFRPLLRHAANSAALLRVRHSHLDMVRPGIAVFGVHPCPQSRAGGAGIPTARLKPVMRVVSEVVALRDLPAGGAVGYGRLWRASRPSRIATIPIGYADGLTRALGERGDVLICGRRAPIVGAVSMDLTTVDVTDLPGVRVRDEVVVLGPQRGRLGSGEITAEELAERTNSIPWEVLTSVSRRVPRFFRQP